MTEPAFTPLISQKAQVPEVSSVGPELIAGKAGSPFIRLPDLSPPGGSDVFLKPYISLSEEFTDNFFGTRTGKVSGTVTRLMPGFNLIYNSRKLDMTATYYLDYRHYNNGVRNDELTHSLNGTGKVRVIDNFLFMDVSDSYSRVSLDATRDTTKESLFLNQTDSNSFSASPYLEFRLGARGTLTTRYTYNNIYYSNDAAVNKVINGVSIMFDREMTTKLHVVASASYSFIANSSSATFNRILPTIGIRYNYSDQSFVNLDAGYFFTNASPQNVLAVNNSTASSPYWNVTINHSFGTVNANAYASTTFDTNPGSAYSEQRNLGFGMQKTFTRSVGKLHMNYTDVTTDVAGANSTQGVGGGGSYSYDFTPKIVGRMDVSLDRFGIGAKTVYGSLCYRIIASPSVSYELSGDTRATLTYSYITNSDRPMPTTNSVDTNVVVIQLTKSFLGVHW